MRFLIIYRRYVIWLRDFFKVFKKEKITQGKEKITEANLIENRIRAAMDNL